MILLIDLLLYWLTKWRLFYWISVVMIIGYLSALAFIIGMYISFFMSL